MFNEHEVMLIIVVIVVLDVIDLIVLIVVIVVFYLCAGTDFGRLVSPRVLWCGDSAARCESQDSCAAHDATWTQTTPCGGTTERGGGGGGGGGGGAGGRREASSDWGGG